MSDIKGKNFLLGITGSIAAYKAAYLTRLLIKEGASVKVIMTPLAKEFITPLTMATLSKNPILVDFFDPENGNWNSHVDLGAWADGYIIAPATANTMAKMANGIADNLLLTTYLSAKCPVFIAPAMDLDMYKHQTNLENINKLRKLGHIFIEPEEGELASGLIGKGRLAQPETIIEHVKAFYKKKKSLKSKIILITAGPTYENIDAVRFIGNYSSGKMGYAIAEECACRGAKVILVSGPVNIKPIHENIELINITSAAEMFNAAKTNFEKVDVAILTAAVADFTPEQLNNSKIKRKDQGLTIQLKPTQDIAKELGNAKKNKILIGFALEIENEIENAIEKLKRKNFDFIVLNSMNDIGACFNVDTNKITIIDNKEQKTEFKIKHKNLVAIDIIDKLEEYL
ncbi:MAG: bifunctional phosphopantothenoylcysteine decarboxylase/phosphopantothenate--cysteine ligase CoaBC [Bacteroidales bacterium]|nr:bifunctional phosphopantothenoylcysteine decarboxylase/phosphopantothenate--cysteine ligase CoaBC [Bacteroidales bacterium]MDD4215778.1 bifunctional phosphopantothenoylcysteine decarboxylase/phosphopantothenate--cysteine ligase CoaBC [Bacteroidales bacterium]